MTTYYVSGTTYENSIPIDNLIIVYKGDRTDLASMGEELSRVTADADGTFEVTFADWPAEVFVVAIDPTDTSKYDAYMRDWLVPALYSFDQYYEQTVVLMHMEGVNGGTTFTDEKGNVCTAVGDAVTSTTQFKAGTSSAYFDGSGNDRVSVAHNANMALGTSPFTIECWVYLDGALSEAALLATKRPNNSVYGDFLFFVGSDGQLGYYVSSSSGGPWFSFNAACGAVPISEWVHVALVRDGTDFRTFINGVEGGGSTSGTAIWASTYDILLGSEGNSTNNLSGYIDEFRFTVGTARYTEDFIPRKSAFPDDTDQYFNSVVSLLHMEGADEGTSFTDEIGNVVTAGTGASTEVSQFKYGTSSAEFDGSATAHLQVAYNSSMQLLDKDFTIEFYVYLNNLTGQKTLATRRVDNTSQGDFVIYAVGATLQVWHNDGGGWFSDTTAGTLASLTWQHIALVREGSAFSVYIDGSLTGSITNGSSLYADTADLYIGGEGNDTFQMDGFIDEFRMTVGVARYLAPFTPLPRAFQDS